MLRLLDLIWQIFKYSLVLTIARLATTAFGWEFGVSRQYLRLLEWLLEQGQARIEKVESRQRMHLDNELNKRNDNFNFNFNSGNELERPITTTTTTTTVSNSNSNSNSSFHEHQNSNIKEAEAEEEGGGDDDNDEIEAKQEKGLIVNKLDSKLSNGNHIKRKVSIRNGHFEFRFIKQEEEEEPDEGDTPIAAASNGGLAAAATTTIKSIVSGHQQNLQRRRRVSTPDGPPVFLLDDYDEEDELQQQQQQLGDECDESRGANFSADHNHHRHEFHLEDATRFVVKGVSAIIDDEVTKRFTPEELKTWNLLTRTNAKNYQFMSRSLGLCWLLGLLIRYAILMPLRIMFTLTGSVWLICSMTLLGLVPKPWRDRPYRLLSLMSFRMLSCGITSRLKFHNKQYRAIQGDICVANHTSPIDVVLLACDNCYALVGQRHGGLLGLLEVALSRAANHVWFDRGEMRDRQLVTKRLKEHIGNKRNLPVLIFPEGTCINNSAVMMFRKGSFETTDRICPVAIKYDPRFGDPFWNSSKQTYLQYLLMMMSSWAIKCDVWYLPPMERFPNESSAEFANRVKAEIAKQGGLVDLAWDGQLKRSSVKPTWLYQQQEDYVKRLKLE